MIAEISAASYAVAAARLPRNDVNPRPSRFVVAVLRGCVAIHGYILKSRFPRSCFTPPSSPSASFDLLFAVNPCLDPTDVAYSCEVDGDGLL